MYLPCSLVSCAKTTLTYILLSTLQAMEQWHYSAQHLFTLSTHVSIHMHNTCVRVKLLTRKLMLFSEALLS